MGFEPVASALALQCSTSLSYKDPYTGGRPPVYGSFFRAFSQLLKLRFTAMVTYSFHFTFITRIAGDTLLTKMPAELPSTEQIFTETCRLVPLLVHLVMLGQ